MKWFLYSGVLTYKLGDDFLAYAPLTSETAVISSTVYDMLHCLSLRPMTVPDLFDELFLDRSDDDCVDFIHRSLKQLFELGFICNDNSDNSC